MLLLGSFKAVVKSNVLVIKIKKEVYTYLICAILQREAPCLPFQSPPSVPLHSSFPACAPIASHTLWGHTCRSAPELGCVHLQAQTSQLGYASCSHDSTNSRRSRWLPLISVQPVRTGRGERRAAVGHSARQRTQVSVWLQNLFKLI